MPNKEIAVIIRAIDKFTKTAERVEQKTGALGKAFKQLGQVAAVAFATDKVVDFFASTIEAAEQQQSVLEQLQGVYESTGGVVGLTVDELVEFAQSLQNVTTYSDEVIEQAEALMLTFKEVQGDVFKESIKLALDMSTLFKQDLKSSVIQLGKALNDPVQGLGALRRVGVSFTKEQEDMIKTLVESGKTMEAQKIILQELRSEMGGQAVRAAQTYAGKLKQLHNLIGDWKEQIGFAIIKNDKMVEGIDAINNAIKDMIAEGEQGQSAISDFASVIGEFIKSTAGGIKGLVKIVAWVLRDILGLAKTISTIIASILAQVVTMIEGSAKVLDKIIHLKFKQAYNTAKAYGNAIKNIRKDALDDLINAFKIQGDTADEAADKTIKGLHKVKKTADDTKKAVEGITLHIRKPKLRLNLKESKKDALAALGLPDDKTVQEGMDRLVETVTDGFNQAFYNIQYFAGLVDGVVGNLADTLVDAMNGVKVNWQQTFDSILKSFERMIVEMLIKFAVIEAVSAALSAITGTPMISSGAALQMAAGYGNVTGVTAFATGGYVDRPTIALVGEHEPEYIIPESKMPVVHVHVHNATPNTYVEIFETMPDGAIQKIKEVLT